MQKILIELKILECRGNTVKRNSCASLTLLAFGVLTFSSCSRDKPQSLRALNLSYQGAATENQDKAEDSSTPQFLIDAGATIVEANFRTLAQGRYLVAENGGGGAVNANRSQASSWETFKIIDKNGGALQDGDFVYIQTTSGQFLQVTNGTSLSINASSRNPENWELFRIIKLNGGVIGNGATIGFKSFSNGKFISALNGGGAGVDVHGLDFGTWERFYIGARVTNTPVVLATSTSDQWRLVWSDEFNGTSLDESKWVYEVQKPYWLNNELQNYTDRRPENVRVANGNLIIEARKDNFGGEYSSGRIKTQGKVSWTYGRVEARIQVPSGFGTWPAFWMMPDNQSRGWPACGEIDIMEHVGYDPNVIHATLHSAKYNWSIGNQRTATTHVEGAVSGFHVYAMEWYPDRIDMFVDGVKYFSAANDNGGPDSWPYNSNFHLILNLAVGGTWGGAMGVDPNIWPKQMLVDYVRVYQK